MKITHTNDAALRAYACAMLRLTASLAFAYGASATADHIHEESIFVELNDELDEFEVEFYARYARMLHARFAALVNTD